MERNTLTFADMEVIKRIDSVKHILKDIEIMLDWSRINKILATTDYRNTSYYGRDCYSPEIMFRILLIQRIYGYSEREMENQMQFNSLYMWFCKLSYSSPVPDHVTIHRWRERFIKFNIYQKVFDDFHVQLMEKGYHLKNATIVDATIVRSAARPKVKQSTTELEHTSDNSTDSQVSIKSISTSKDPEASWTFKNGNWEYGFKEHQAVNTDGLITAVITTPANVHDGTILPEIVEIVNPVSGTQVIGDKAYDSNKNRDCLSEQKLLDGLMRKKPKNKSACEEQISINKSLSSVRFVAEQTFGTLKRVYNMSRSKYMGLQKTHNWCLFGAFVYNLSRCRKLTWDYCAQT